MSKYKPIKIKIRQPDHLIQVKSFIYFNQFSNILIP